MENIKKNPLSLQLNADDFLPASNEEKQSLVIMRESVNFWKDGLRRLKKNKIAMVSFVFIIAIAIFAYLLPAVWPYSYSEQMKGSNNLKPFEYSASEQARIDAGEKVFPHILGTDRMGRDFAVRIMMGTRVSLSVGLIASVLVLIIGATYGAVAAFAGGWVDNIMMRITDILYTIPDILLIILLGMALKDPLDKLSTQLQVDADPWPQHDLHLHHLCSAVLGGHGAYRAQPDPDPEGERVRHRCPRTGRFQRPYHQKASAHQLHRDPGVPAPLPSLGSLATDAVKGMNTYPHLLIAPALMISVMILVFNLFGDGLRDAFDPKLKN